MKAKWEVYKELELIPDSMWNAMLAEAKLPHLTWRSWFNNFWVMIIDFLTRDTDPHIWEKRDRYGNVVWCVYDPTTEKTFYFSSTAEVYIWLEERYYFRNV